jgi:two-component system, OmpR family, phosphate regulon sensor histidine kinase PhoR
MRELLLHDMRTSLATISGYAQLLQRRAAKRLPHLPDLLRGLESIEAAAKRVEQLLDELARLPADDDVDHAQPRRTAVDLVALAARMSTYTYAPGRQRITVLPSVPELIGWWDSTRLEHVLMNLFGNAVKYSPKDRDVLVTVQRTGDCAVLRIADQGVGIPPAEVCQIFEPGYRASNVVGQFPGTGIGLAGAYQIVAEHDGTITVESELGAGTTVTVRLPVRAEATM